LTIQNETFQSFFQLPQPENSDKSYGTVEAIGTTDNVYNNLLVPAFSSTVSDVMLYDSNSSRSSRAASLAQQLFPNNQKCQNSPDAGLPGCADSEFLQFHEKRAIVTMSMLRSCHTITKGITSIIKSTTDLKGQWH
jgi:hypothetical protein